MGNRVSLDSFQSAFVDEAIDRDTGAPVEVRAAVGGAHSDKDRLTTLRQYYPDAMPFGEDNFVFTDPDTGQPKLYNNEGWVPDVGDIASIGRELSGTVGGVGGAVGGGALAGAVTGGVGAVPGAIAGAGAGTAGGEAAFDWVAENFLNSKDTRTAGERAADLALAGATGMIGEGAGRAIAPVGKAVFGKLSGAADNLAAFERQGVEATPAMLSPNRSIQKIESAMENTPFAQGRVLEKQTRASEQLAGAASRRAQEMAAIGAMGRAESEGAEAAATAAGDVTGPLTATRADRIITSQPNAAAQTAEEAAKKITGYSARPLEEGTEAGMALQQGASDAAKRYAAKRTSLDQAVLKTIGENRPVRLAAVGKLWHELTDQLAKGGEVAADRVGDARAELNKVIKQAARSKLGAKVDELPADPKDWAAAGVDVDDVLSDGTVPFTVVRNARTNVGTSLGAADATGQRALGKAEMGNVQRALREDIYKAADEVSPTAGKMQRELDEMITAFRTDTSVAAPSDLLTEITGADSPEAAWKAVRAMATGSPTKFQHLVSQLKPHEADELAASILDGLGKSKPGAIEEFSPDLFHTNWEKLPKGTKDLLFGKERHRALRGALDDLAVISKRMKASGKYRNRSGTGNVQAWGGFLNQLSKAALVGGGGGAATGLVDPITGTVAAAAGGYGLGRAWTSPRLIRALVGLGKASDAGTLSSAQLKSRFIKQLAAQKWAGDPAEQFVHSLIQEAPEPQPQ